MAIKLSLPDSGTHRAKATSACEQDWLGKLRSVPEFKKLAKGGRSDFYYVFRIGFMAGAEWAMEQAKKMILEAEKEDKDRAD